ncbi:class I SAM-dependent methyltransferase [Ktedonosporobacter rubrisoli]|uniref:Class I SAM-dependent methyltransferase n=1 Tax=Ktedonosporobacter rubrisoli TaxID=2509675 RepID=A0A4P6JL06_KTERU|nr:class I SAM-dependent methyltransferase [Ktedonosporobacter rubrisoli]QBD75855.1 class I SAM-dependent methyltransferase [Ktedonosporobacter rubrisoli]
MDDYRRVTTILQASYNRESAAERNKTTKDSWKIEVRQDFLELLAVEAKTTLLEVGAGTGTDGLFFQEHGLKVICTDLSSAMVELCREKGLEAYVMDFLSLDFPSASFEAIYALNCLLHVPGANLPEVLGKLRDLLRPGGLFFLGVYGGIEREGINEQDWHNPPRFFAFHTDEFMQQAVAPFFELVSFKAIPLQRPDRHFQSLVLRRPLT